MEKPLLMIGDTVRHHLYGVGRVVGIGYRQATVRFHNGIHSSITTDNLVRVLPA